MAEINHEIKIAAPPERVFNALTTVNGLCSWYTAQIEGGTGVGNTLVFRFEGRPTFRWQVERIEPPTHVEWRCVEGPSDAKGTTVTFAVLPTGDGRSLVELAHRGWPGTHGNFRKCNTYWGMLLHQLQQHVEKGTSQPVFS
jgi:uncharacterized protein YndB with AHSA1/START domain